MTKYIFVTGGVVSGIGKGITTACIGRLLRDRGLRIAMQKIDPYLNVDAGTMNPHEHGEVFVTEDGAETDLDLGHYERFVDINLSRLSNITTGTIYGAVIDQERRGDYLGKTVQVIPHVTDEIKRMIRLAAEGADVMIVEVGGTVGDIEGLPFLEAIRQMRIDVGIEHTVSVHVSLIAYVEPGGQSKSKPTQHSVRELRNIGIQPDAIIARCREPLSPELRQKISLFCNVPQTAVIEGVDTKSIYEIPLLFEQQGLARLVLERLGMPDLPADHSEWAAMVDRARNPKQRVSIALVGKYMGVRDAYICVTEALKHAGFANQADVDLHWVDSEEIERTGPEANLRDIDAVVVPGGYGDRGIEGKIAAIRYVRENGIPFLGLCLGLQCAVIEFARNVCGLEGAHSTEFDPDTPHPVLDLLPEQRSLDRKGATQRLGAEPVEIREGTRAMETYREKVIYERHRHRYEVNSRYHDIFCTNGLVLSAMSPTKHVVEMIELPDHPWFMASQFHPEFKSRPTRSAPMFREFVSAALARRSAIGRDSGVGTAAVSP
jgi:CTP synthase